MMRLSKAFLELYDKVDADVDLDKLEGRCMINSWKLLYEELNGTMDKT